MPYYTLPFDDIATGVVANSFKTAAAIIVADTIGHRVRLQSFYVGPADDTPLDHNIAIQIARIADVSTGTTGSGVAVTSANMPKHDPGSVDCLASGVVNYSTEPTVFETKELWIGGMNMRGGLIVEHFDDDDKYIATRDMLLAIRIAPRSTTALRVSGALKFEVY